MTSVAFEGLDSLADVVKRLGDVPLDRIRLRPLPGTAVEEDVLKVSANEDRVCELVDGVLVEKPTGFTESILASYLCQILGKWVREKNLGFVTAPDGTIRLFPGLVRIPDVAFVSWSRMPGGRRPTDPMPALAPELSVEVLSASNSAAEMRRKRREYFEAGVRLVWLVDPLRRTVRVYTAAEEFFDVGEDGVVSGDPVLPGFSVSVRDLFGELDRHG
jgi:Uma2 family endonuclease